MVRGSDVLPWEPVRAGGHDGHFGPRGILAGALSAMFRGNHAATVDAKGRLKMPAPFLRRLGPEERDLFVTSLDGDSIQVYPMPVWREYEAGLGARGDLDPATRRLRRWANASGAEVTLDTHGRLLLPQLLRKRFPVEKVDVVGMGRYLEVWDHDALWARLEQTPLTDEILAGLAGTAGAGP